LNRVFGILLALALVLSLGLVTAVPVGAGLICDDDVTIISSPDHGAASGSYVAAGTVDTLVLGEGTWKITATGAMNFAPGGTAPNVGLRAEIGGVVTMLAKSNIATEADTSVIGRSGFAIVGEVEGPIEVDLVAYGEGVNVFEHNMVAIGVTPDGVEIVASPDHGAASGSYVAAGTVDTLVLGEGTWKITASGAMNFADGGAAPNVGLRAEIGGVVTMLAKSNIATEDDTGVIGRGGFGLVGYVEGPIDVDLVAYGGGVNVFEHNVVAIGGRPHEVWVCEATGSDDNPGTEAEPFATIQHGIDSVAEGGTVNVKAGTYGLTDMGGDTWEPVSITKSLKLRGAGSDVTLLDAGFAVNHCDVVAVRASNVVIEGFHITGGDFGVRVPGLNHGDDVSDVSFLDVRVENCTESGFVFDGAVRVDSVSLTECLAQNNQNFGIYLAPQTSAGTVTLTNTSANDNGRAGFSCQGSIENLSITGGTFNDNTGCGDFYGFGIELRNCVGTIEGVTAEGNGMHGPHIEGADYAGGGAGIVVKDGSALVSENNTEGYAASQSGGGNHITIIGANLQNNMNGLWIEDPDAVANWDACDDWEGSVAVHFSNIRGNQEFGVLNCLTHCDVAVALVVIGNDDVGNDDEVDATHNWWGDADGPGGEGPGDGDAVSVGVLYEPWLGAAMTDEPTGCTADRDSGEDAFAETDNVSADATGGDETTTITVAEYVDDPTDVDHGFAVNDEFFFDVHVGGTAPHTLVVEMKCPGDDCSGLVLKWFDGTEWLDVTPAAEDDNGVLQFTLDENSSPTIAELTGTPFGAGREPPPVIPPVGGTGHLVNRLVLLAPWLALAAVVAGALVFVRRRHAQS